MRKPTVLSAMLGRIASLLPAVAHPTDQRRGPLISGRSAPASLALRPRPAHPISPRPSAPFAVAPMLATFGPYIFVIAATCSYYVAIAPLLLGHTDLGWHLAAGDLIRSQGSVPAHDSWSFTAGQTPWINHSWLWDVVASLLFQYGHFTALILVTIVLGGAIAAGLTAICLASGASPIATSMAVISACILYPTFAVPDVFLAASPNITTLLFCVIFYGVCLQRRHLWLAPASMAVWVNVHGGFVLGFFILGVFAAVAMARRNAPDLTRYLLVIVACAAATLVNPLGWHVYAGVLRTLGHFVQQYITEWQPYYTMMRLPQCIPTCLYVLIFIVLELTGRGNVPINVPVEARILSWCFLLLGIWQQRYLSIFFLFSTLPMALHLSGLRWAFVRQTTNGPLLAVAGLFVFCLLPVLYWRAVPETPGLPPIYPDTELAYLERNFPHARLLNHWNYGGFLIFAGRGNPRLFVDGRAATAYPDDLLRDYFGLVSWEVDEAAWKRVLAKYGIDAVLWPKAHAQLASFLVGKENWTQVYSGNVASLYVKAR
jgi:hypothetical protein